MQAEMARHPKGVGHPWEQLAAAACPANVKNGAQSRDRCVEREIHHDWRQYDTECGQLDLHGGEQGLGLSQLERREHDGATRRVPSRLRREARL